MEDKKFCKFCGEKIDADAVVCTKCGRQVQKVKRNSEETKEVEVVEEDKFYTKTWFMWVLLVLFAPLGIFFMWKFHPEMKKNLKIGLSIGFGLLFLIIILTNNAPSDSGSYTNNSSKPDTPKVEVIDFSLMKEDEILTWCNEKNLVCVFKRDYSDVVENDGFISQSVQANEQVPEQTKITITFSKGKAPTVSQQNAVKKADSYLSVMAFSRKGLIEQLEYEGFSHDDAIYGVDHVIVDWEEQAVKKAKSYLDIMAFSRKGLIEQLEYEGFTHEQAVYGVEQNGL